MNCLVRTAIDFSYFLMAAVKRNSWFSQTRIESKRFSIKFVSSVHFSFWFLKYFKRRLINLRGLDFKLERTVRFYLLAGWCCNNASWVKDYFGFVVNSFERQQLHILSERVDNDKVGSNDLSFRLSLTPCELRLFSLSNEMAFLLSQEIVGNSLISWTLRST
jgi:hypothetical protein